MTPFTRFFWLALAIAAAACGGPTARTDGSGNTQAAPAPGMTFRIIAGSENKDLEPIFRRYAAEKGVTVETKYLGSVDIAAQIEAGATDADAVLPASMLWIQFADRNKVVKRAQSVMRSPVVFGIKQSVAKSLGWQGVGSKVSVNDIMDAAESGKLRFAMTSATQSNSGTSAYLGFLSAMSGSPDVLMTSHLNDAKVQEQTRRLLATVDRSSGSSGWLKDMLLKDPDAFDAMVNYEAMVIAANKDLTAQGRETLCAIYPYDGMSIADFPFGYVDHGDAAKAKFFDGLQAYLLSAPVQTEIETLGRRAGAIGLANAGADKSVFNPDWCIDTTRTISPVPLPSEPVIREALELYQTILRKPSFSVFVLDYSGSMNDYDRADDMKKAMATVLEPARAKRYMLQPSARDVNIVVPFSDDVIGVWKSEGNKPEELRTLLNKVSTTTAGGGTSLYAATAKAFQVIEEYRKAHPDRSDPKHLSQYFPAVILLTDGVATDQKVVFDQVMASNPAFQDIPIFAIRFGEATESQLNAIVRGGRVFDGSKDVGKAIREAKQYN